MIKKDFNYRENAQMTATGSWYIDFKKQRSFWDDQTKKILEYPKNYIPKLHESHTYYAEEHLELALDCYLKCAKHGIPFDTEIKMATANGRIFWAKAIGKAIYNNEKKIIAIRGVFRDIDKEKSKVLNLENTSKIIASQNSRLFNFAHIVSHNLRSHSSNLSLISQLIEDADTIEDKLELFTSIKDISESLNLTINHLNEVVAVQTKTHISKVEVCFDTIINNVNKAISLDINETKTTINTDFSLVSSIQYIPAYLESILLNLITNAIKYKHPDRAPVINIKTYIENEKSYLELRDNGVGIDLEKFGNRLFGMYNTFHYNKDAVGIGLFLTKNQVESLGGEIFVESEVNVGTVFKIRF